MHVKHQTELDNNHGCCLDCRPPTPEPEYTPNPEPEPETNPASPTPEPDSTLSLLLQLQQQVTHQSQLIGQLQEKVSTLENCNRQLLQLYSQDMQQAQRRVELITTLMNEQNF